MDERQFYFEWNEAKAAENIRKHDVSFDLARTIFSDPHLLTVADLEHSEAEDRWFSIGYANNGIILSVAYVWFEIDPAIVVIRMISARKSTKTEMYQYQTGI